MKKNEFREVAADDIWFLVNKDGTISFALFKEQGLMRKFYELGTKKIYHATLKPIESFSMDKARSGNDFEYNVIATEQNSKLHREENMILKARQLAETDSLENLSLKNKSAKLILINLIKRVTVSVDELLKYEQIINETFNNEKKITMKDRVAKIDEVRKEYPEEIR